MTEAGPPDRNETQTDRSAPDAAGGARPATHGFLFADLRDYTAFVHARGDHAAAALLGRYRTLVRGEIASFAGAEIRTEGDSFYVVFDSASAAVRCGLAIIAAAGETATEPDPIHVGVGVHAGETVETGEGYVGSAVNIAARLCSVAKTGELIVSDTVRALTRTYLDVTFEPLGARRLKGVDEPITVYRVVPGGAPGAARVRTAPARSRRTRWLAAIGAALVVVVAVVIVAVAATGLPGASPAVTSSPGTAGATSPGSGAVASPSSGAASPAGSPSASPSAAPSGGLAGMTGDELELLARIPKEFQPFCRRSSPSDGSLGGDLASLRCDLPVGTADVFGADSVWYDTYSAGGLMSVAMNGIATRQGLTNVAGGTAVEDRCAMDATPGIGRWSMGITFTGQLACYVKDGAAWLAWTYEGQQIAARAVRRDGAMASLVDWWREQASGFLR